MYFKRNWEFTGLARLSLYLRINLTEKNDDVSKSVTRTEKMSKNAIENKVLEFPKARSLRKRLLDRGQDQKAALGLSLVSVLIMTVFLNEWIVKSQGQLDGAAPGTRGIASVEDYNALDEIRWEHELAQKLSQEKAAAKSLLAVKPTLKDELIFGFLEGKYKTRFVGSRIESFDFTGNHAGDEPLVIKEKGEFLTIFKSVFSVNYAKVRLESREAQSETYTLLGKSNQDLGQARFQLDSEGRVLSLKISQ